MVDLLAERFIDIWHESKTARPTVAAATALGSGLGGFFDGILFHQILQLHNMLSTRIATDTLVGAKVNMVWDGLFHSVVWVVTVIGVFMLWHAAKRADTLFDNRLLVGGFLLGWGLFNVVEGVIDHHLINAHHVYQLMGQSVWDYAFFAWGAAMILVGWMLIKVGSKNPLTARA